MAEQSPITGYEPKDLIETSIEYTPINFPTRKKSFTTDIDDVPTTVASDITETIEAGQLTSPLFTQEREVSANPFGVFVFQQAAASGSQQQPASSSVINLWQTSYVGRFGKLQRGDESSSNVERSLLRGKRCRDLLLSLNPPPPPTSKPSMAKTEPLPRFQKAAQAGDEAWQQTVDGHNGPSVTNPTVSELEHPSSASQDDDGDDMDFSSNPRKSRLSAPQLQAQLHGCLTQLN